jgi:hypothetical protein
MISASDRFRGVDDARCYHGVTPVEAENPARPAYRDVLVVTFRKKPAA